ncbi:uncharacterized protein ACLA_048540 [Aspergillus clavatus NRRL 1]|uniref:NmrA-like domain-containing protein n=1 Tax=Aspergillus clavatus (strain ATCC 1007 / CBS 513.65 / DSM 816 / NCTC 3887 / NRRL 1 / QM 1276 / 107) TaxID=344612 RepID=A1CHM9_ASPCL|nr:uncharacterized protein ACLA_048540 [Aspergillus clavatus NRRL 1]EAW10384.1 hypothetical protein ACLA_048540 [Aspergillus clavatus NRRL 1]
MQPVSEKLFKGANAAYAFTETVHDEQMRARDSARGKALADAAVAASVEFYIYSTLPSITKISGGEFTRGEHFDVKAEVEDYICSLPIRSAFLSPGSFMQVFLGMMLYIQDFGYWGPETEELLVASVAEAHGKLTTLEGFFDKHGVNFQSGH